MILSAAQFSPADGKIDKNLGLHYNLIDLAYTHNAQLVIFPELSITGYVREGASNYAFTENDKRLSELRKLSRDYRMIIVVGAPIQIESKLHIGSFVLLPNNSKQIYTKQFLHEGEELAYLPSFDYNPIIQLEDENISFAICADIEHAEHAVNACNLNTSTYMPSIFYSKNGIQGGLNKLEAYAKKHQMNVLMSNFCGQSYGLDAGGRSSFWNKTGQLIAEMDEESQGLVIVEQKHNLWKGSTIYTNYE